MHVRDYTINTFVSMGIIKWCLKFQGAILLYRWLEDFAVSRYYKLIN